MQRPLFRHIVSLIKEEIERQRSRNFISISPGQFTNAKVKVGDVLHKVRRGELMLAWPALAESAGLVNDNTFTNTWTVPGRGYFDYHSDAEERRLMARRHARSDSQRRKLEGELEENKEKLRRTLSELGKGNPRRQVLVTAYNKRIRKLKKELGL